MMNYKAEIDKEWLNTKPTMKWVSLESTLVTILTDAISDSAKVALAKEAIDAFTKRGHFSPDEYKQEEVY